MLINVSGAGSPLSLQADEVTEQITPPCAVRECWMAHEQHIHSGTIGNGEVWRDVRQTTNSQEADRVLVRKDSVALHGMDC